MLSAILLASAAPVIQPYLSVPAYQALQLCATDNLYHLKTETCPAPPDTTPPPTSSPVLTKCADENGTCVLGAGVTGTVRYLEPTSGKYNSKVVTGQVLCGNGVFGDPYFGRPKVCMLENAQPAPTPPPTPLPSAPSTQPPPVVQPPAPTAGYVKADSIDGLKDIPTTDFAPGIGHGLATRGPTPTNVPDNVGAMRFICAPGQILQDDPIVYPNQPGKSHWHQFYGNEDANASSTYATLRAHGRSTCSGPQFALNRSAYWMPAMFDGQGNIVRPSYVTVYYKRFPKGSAMCSYMVSIGGGCVMQPNGLRWIIGRNMQNWNAPMLGSFHWTCTKASGATLHKVTGDSGAYPLLGDVTSFCTAGWNISLAFDAADCWDGINLDTPDHQSHLANARYVTQNGHNFDACPASHPYRIPVFRLTAAYSVLPGDTPSKWSLSCDAMAPAGSPVGACAHLDLFDAWDPNQKRTWTDNCIDGLKPYPATINYSSWTWAFPAGVGPVSGQGGDQCNLTVLTGAGQPPWGFGAPPDRLVPIAQLPAKQPVMP